MRALLLSFILVMSFAFTATAAEVKKRARTVAEDVDTGPGKLWMGIASDSMVTMTATPALSALFQASPKAFIQTYFVATTINPFTFGVGANYKTSIVGDFDKGFHIGGGFGIGRMGAKVFFLNFNAIAGFHFKIVERVFVNVDSGLMIGVRGGGGPADIAVGGHSTMMGLSLLYQL